MKIIFATILVIAFVPFTVLGQNSRAIIHSPCNLSVSIDSIVVKPCFRMGNANVVNGGSCGCGNTLWAIVAGGTAPYTYTWSTTGGTVYGNADTLHGACYMLWFVNIKDANGCLDSASLNVVIPPTDTSSTTTGISQSRIMNDELRVYPNPSRGEINLNISQFENLKMNSVEIYNSIGECVKQLIIHHSSLILDISDLSEGNYFLKVVGNNGQKTVKFSVVK
ncbi:MAG: T9SS type A sorting domain-containing protein [Bacteroidia bacterium]